MIVNSPGGIRFSVIIPTINRSSTLRQAIEALCQQENPGCTYEIIVIDNGSKDDTKKVVEDLAKKNKVPIRYLFEPRSGSAFARNTGFRAAAGEILGLIDDDVVVDRDWVKTIVKVYDDPEVSCAGGKVILRWVNGAAPEWIRPFTWLLGETPYKDEPRELTCPETIVAGNFSIRRDVLLKVGGYNPDGNSITDRPLGDGESGLCLKVYAAGGRIFWVPDALGWHVQDVRRMTPGYFSRRGRVQGMGNAYTLFRKKKGSCPAVFGGALKLSVRYLVLMLDILVRFRYVKAWTSEVTKFFYNFNLLLGLNSYLFRIYTDRELRRLVMREDWINI